MDLLNRSAKAANTVLMIFVALAAAIMLISGIYVLNDIYYTNRTAFASYDLLQYRPQLNDDTEEEKYTFSELEDLNPDTVGWIEMFGTNINYPVVQGNDNLEYLNKDIFGYNTLTGSIYLAAENDPGINDWYNLIYGHHMDNGAMFGDIEKYLDPEFFASHSSGILQTSHGDYSIKVFACVRTNAYEDAVYQISGDAEEKYPVLRSYIEEHAENSVNIPDIMDNSHILGMSTCSDAVTDGRIVLFASISPWDKKTDGNAAALITKADDVQPDKMKLFAIGHKVSSGKWAFLNLMCVICTLLTLLPVWALRKKFGQMSYSKKTIRRLEDRIKENENDTKDKQNDDAETVVKDLKHFLRKCRIGIIIEIITLIISVIAFLLTEDITARMGIRDRWTGLMILIAAAALLADIICLRYRGKLPDKEEAEEEA